MKSLYGYVFSFFLLLIMFGCADSVLDSWPGIGDLTIESGNKRFSDNSFGLKSDLILPGTTSDVSYSITSDCYRREQLSDEPDFEQRVYSKTLKYQASGSNPSSLPAINYLNELVLVYPTFFKKCDFKIKATNSVGSTDSFELKDIVFKYDESDHGLNLDDSSVANNNLRKGLYESRSKLKAFYVGKFKRPSVLSASHSRAHQISRSRISDAKLVCYTNQISTLDLETFVDDTTNFHSLNRMHPVTEDHPLENCIFTALDLQGRLVTSKPFDLIRDHQAIISALKYSEIGILPELTSKQISFLSKRFADIPDTPRDLLRVRYTNTSNKPKILRFKESEISNASFFLFNKSEAKHYPKDTSIFKRHYDGSSSGYYPKTIGIQRHYNSRHFYTEETITCSYRKYKYLAFARKKTHAKARFYWSATNLKSHKESLLIIPPQSSGMLVLSMEVDELDFVKKDISSHDGFIIAPQKKENFIRFSLISPNEFKWNVIQNKSVDELFYPGTRFSALPKDIEGPSNHKLLENHAFHIMYVNKHRHEPGFFEARYKIVPAQIPSDDCESESVHMDLR